MMRGWLGAWCTVCVMGGVLCGGALGSEVAAGAGQRVVLGCDVCPEVVVVSGGTFYMGNPTGEGDADEHPRREVAVETFAVGVWEVSVGEFTAYLEATGQESLVPTCARQEDRGRAAACMSWEEAQDYVVWLSERTGMPYRLLSEAEWEYVANQATKFGVFDMRGGVWEWVEDCWHGDYEGAPSNGGAWREGGDCGRRVLRGGSWRDEGYAVRAQNREFGTRRLRQVNLGLRVARSVTAGR